MTYCPWYGVWGCLLGLGLVRPIGSGFSLVRCAQYADLYYQVFLLSCSLDVSSLCLWSRLRGEAVLEAWEPTAFCVCVCDEGHILVLFSCLGL